MVIGIVSWRTCRAPETGNGNVSRMDQAQMKMLEPAYYICGWKRGSEALSKQKPAQLALVGRRQDRAGGNWDRGEVRRT
jgi:hypothetical protein